MSVDTDPTPTSDSDQGSAVATAERPGPAVSEVGADGATEQAVVLTVTPAAMEVVQGVLNTEPDPEQLGLRVEITGTNGAEYSYDLSFENLSDAADDDLRVLQDGLTVMIPAATVPDLTGAVLDTPAAGSAGLVIRNPNRPDPLAGVELDRSGDMASQVQQLLEQVINPGLASHGGFATLVGVDDDNQVYITLGGGCQGCSMTQMTLTQGIQVQLNAAIPEIGNVIDVTDHASGDNPFY
ncbi:MULTISPECIES: iron-sulfur cluster biogenesis protein NfuA [Candidatus Neomicrothrix]|uniref:Putative Nitrogen-fixing NifU domain protein n=1 Tax=Candidatus Neomicrothrix parvicella RN1 TaxID=1229780 RepID=R4Z7S5_9ACTN|nr:MULTISPECIES: iron-sulfur cluster biogenesis protein NfuA [Microthrix]HBX08589.1 iron-sulfur cluster biogenesis protein NfuA [Candidatus Microthrix parvicella]MBK6502076.1 iron-sulfur cluster biogenesis protein NfuA [Candidatus Microthrix sp.]MBK7018523.1 iron-sulfur cluster biogenesis protein NfuA [Candidatus Microthrix sp.]MBK7322011.1 iron-sulfur cluster biogenesis protein NfuA [Candidatus Microthrix sp.]MBL0205892.1 iron-sulfur cluster biogenesis protein NfuA [Candidatus Microthrix sp.]